MLFAKPRQKIRLGDLLVKAQVISQTQLDQALLEQQRTGRRLGRVLVDLNYLTEQRLLDCLSQQLNIPYINLNHYQFIPELVQRLPEVQARRFRVLLLAEQDQGYLLAMADPTDLQALDDLQRLLKKPLQQAVVREADLLRAIDRLYRRTQEIESLAGELSSELDANDFDLGKLTSSAELSDAPVVKLLRNIFEDAVQMQASDIHIEPDESLLRIRQRVDGVLHEQVYREARIAPALVLRLKLMASLDIAEKRLPQDGRFNIKIKGRSIDVRLATMPVQHGEAVVMRLLDQSAGLLDLDKIGMPEPLLQQLKLSLQRPHGLILVTGPTGSGKTTTLYGALNQLNSPERKIITVEDPVEYRLPRVNQVQVNAKISLSFASVLRTALRQDPDVIMIGEMRDKETVDIGLRAAMTGHLVLSTLHTNDAISSAMRLIDIGVEPYLAASSLRLIIAQRLVRKLCIRCVVPYQPEAQEFIWLRSLIRSPVSEQMTFLKGRGCPDCHNSGYHGRIGVYELLKFDDKLAEALRRDPAEFAAVAREQSEFRTLGEAAFDYASQGLTSLDEVFRIAGEL